MNRRYRKDDHRRKLEDEQDRSPRPAHSPRSLKAIMPQGQVVRGGAVRALCQHPRRR